MGVPGARPGGQALEPIEHLVDAVAGRGDAQGQRRQRADRIGARAAQGASVVARCARGSSRTGVIGGVREGQQELVERVAIGDQARSGVLHRRQRSGGPLSGLTRSSSLRVAGFQPARPARSAGDFASLLGGQLRRPGVSAEDSHLVHGEHGSTTRHRRQYATLRQRHTARPHGCAGNACRRA
jgi:hypothetical protein